MPKKAPRCQHCGTDREVRLDRVLNLLLCGACWVKTPITPPRPPRDRGVDYR